MTLFNFTPQEAGYHILELNASATRNKSSLKSVSSHLDSVSLDEILTSPQTSSSSASSGSGGGIGVASGRSQTGVGSGVGMASGGRSHVMILDEVDGMAGNEDRGGIQVYTHVHTYL